jgi:hypothetical protein
MRESLPRGASRENRLDQRKKLPEQRAKWGMQLDDQVPLPTADTTLARNIVLIACAASAGVHAGLVPAHLAENAWLGLAFTGAVGLLLALTASLARTGEPRRLAAPAAALLAVLIVAYWLSRTVGLAPLEEHVEPVDLIGVLTQVAQLAGLIAALFLCQPAGDAIARAARREVP